PPDQVPFNLSPSRWSFSEPSNGPASLKNRSAQVPAASEPFLTGSAAEGVTRKLEKYDSSPAYPHKATPPWRFGLFSPSTTRAGFDDPLRQTRAARPATSIRTWIHQSCAISAQL